MSEEKGCDLNQKEMCSENRLLRCKKWPCWTPDEALENLKRQMDHSCRGAEGGSVNPTVKEIVKRYLVENEFNGLYCDLLECGCKVHDLMPCNCFNGDCIAGYVAMDEHGDWITQEEKPKEGR